MKKHLPSVCTIVLLAMVLNAFSQDKKLIDLNGKWEFRRAGSHEWMEARVPGCVHTDLMRCKVIPDPYYRDNETKVQWISDIGWEYRKTFFVSDTLFRSPNLELVCKGLDTYANVYLNDSLILVADNMFREWSADIHQYLLIGMNQLRIQFPAVTAENNARYALLSHKLPGDEKVVCRKAAYQFGWDWGPALITSGIWKPIYIRGWDHMNVLNVHYIQNSISDSIADMTAVFTYVASIGDTGYFQVSSGNDVLPVVRLPVKKGVNTARLNFTIKNPKLWWPNGLGEPNLYILTHKVTYLGKLVAEGKKAIGLRTVELRQERDITGASFYFLVNGIPVFMKGANYIPGDNFPSRVKDSAYRALINSAKEAHMNMLRVWGGGIYENDIFYDLCDQNGILVWQDFMFANAMYPENKAFIRNVQTEAMQNVTRLRDHPCLALWCGNNEIDEAWNNWGWQKQYHYSSQDSAEIWKNYQGIFGGTLRITVSKLDSLRPYIASSPLFGWGRTESTRYGDMHYWGVWWGKEPFPKYNEKTGRFMTEYGFQALPAISSINKFTTREDRAPGSSVMLAHQKHPGGYQTIDEYLLRDFRKPKDFESYIYVSQLLQAEGVKIAIEAHRRAKPRCMGTLYWQLNDCWPAISWSSTDYYGVPKALQYFVNNAYRTFLVSPLLENNKVKIYIISDSLSDCHATLHLTFSDFSGFHLSDTTLDINILKSSSALYFEADISDFSQKNNPEKMVLYARIGLNGKTLCKNMLYFVPIKNLDLGKPLITSSVLRNGKSFDITLSSDQLAKNVYLTSVLAGTFSDNFIDLLPGEKTTIVFTPKANVADLNGKLQVRSLFDAY